MRDMRRGERRAHRSGRRRPSARAARRRQRLEAGDLVGRACSRPRQRSMPSSAATAATAGARSPDSSSTASPRGAQLADHRSGIGAQRIVEGEAHRRARPAAPARAPAPTAACRRLRCRTRPGCPAASRPRVRKAQAAPGTSSTPRATAALRRGARQRPRQRMAAGARRARRRAAAPPGSSASERASAGRPRVSVPVLSNTTVSTWASRSSAVADFSSTPRAQQAPAGDHLHRRHGEPERAGAGDDQHRHGVEQRGLPGRPAEQQSSRGRSRAPGRAPPARRGAPTRSASTT